LLPRYLEYKNVRLFECEVVMNKIFTCCLLLLVSIVGVAQKSIESTDQFTISGLVDKPVTIYYADLEKEKIVMIGDFKITNHLGEFKKEYKKVKGVLLLDLMKGITITSPSPKVLSEFYFVLKATDGYSVVVSWNELFNTEIGNSFYLVVEADNKNQRDAPEKILLVSTKDFKTGRRHVKGLQSIEVKRI
jgi:hypothetical protein